jgi:hypothetical protein
MMFLCMAQFVFQNWYYFLQFSFLIVRQWYAMSGIGSPCDEVQVTSFHRTTWPWLFGFWRDGLCHLAFEGQDLVGYLIGWWFIIVCCGLLFDLRVQACLHFVAWSCTVCCPLI